MASTQQVAQAHYLRQKQLAAAAARTAVRQWDLLDRDRLTDSWMGGIGQTVVATTTQAQLAAAQQAPPYLEELAAAEGVPIVAPMLIASALSGIASDGRSLASLLYLPIILVKSLIADGLSLLEAVRRGRNMLALHVATQVGDAGRTAVSVGMTSNRTWVTYIRHVTLPACSRCIILSGTVYSWSTGFLRHPRCDCTMTPRLNSVSPAPANPRELFDRMTPEGQDKAFGKAGADAIREGADLARVVHTRRGMRTAGGRQVTKGGKPMPEQIYKDAAGDRDLAIRLLKQHGFVL